MTALGALQTIGGSLDIVDNESLGSLTGLRSLSSVGLRLDIEKNLLLSNLAGLETLVTVGGLYIDNNDNLINLSGLSNLTSVEGKLYVANNNQLSSLDGLEKLTRAGNLDIAFNGVLSSVTGSSSLTSLGSLSIRNTPISSLAGLEKLTSLSNLVIDDSDLSDLSGLRGLTSIEGDLSLSRNGSMNNLSGLENLTRIGGNLTIISNDLTSISALSSLTSIGGNLRIENNDDLSQCNIEIFCRYLANPPGTVRISSNNTGCNSREEIEDRCPTSIVSPLSSGSTVCAGSTITVTVSATGPARSYAWYRDNTLLSSQTSATLTLPSAQTVDTGMYRVVVSNSVTSLTSTAFNLSVNPTPSVSLSATGPLTCSQLSVSLVATSPDQGSYTFVGPGLNQTGSASTATATQGGLYSVTLTTTSGCSSTATAEVTSSTISPSISLTNTGPLSFTNTSVTLTATATPSGSYSYTFSNGASQQGSSNKALVTTAGVYSVTVIRQDNGCSTITSTTVPGGNNPTVCRGGTTVINVAVEGDPIRYEWYKNSLTTPKLMETPQLFRGTATSSLTLINAQSNTQGNFYLKVTDRSNAIKVYGPYRLTVDASCRAREVAQLETPLQVELAPNPIQQDRLRAVVRGAAGHSLQVELINVSGKPIRQQHWQQAEALQVLEWDMSSQASGMYLLQVISEARNGLPAQRQSVKVVKP
ncbi:hypothetical protein GCM10027577_52610 [Spirosoma fluminis]